jgi:hypothetical protein
MCDRHKRGNFEIAGGVEHPKAASGFRELDFQIADLGIIELPQIDFRPLQSIVRTRSRIPSRSISSRNPWTIASATVLPAAQPLESAWCS